MALYERSLKATAAGCQKLTEALKNSRYTKSSIGDFVQYRKRDGQDDQGVSRATVAKAFKGEPVDRGIFIGLCDLLGLNWQEVAELATSEPSSLEPELIDSPLISFLDNLRSAASFKYSQIPEQEAACEMIRILIFRLVSQQCEDYLVDEFFSNWNQEIFFKSKDILIFEIKLKLLKNKRIHKTFLLSTLQKIGYDKMSLLIDIFLYMACRNHSFLSNSRDYEIVEKYFDQDSLNHQKFKLLTCCMAINQSKAFEERYLCEAQNLLENLEVSNFSTLWLAKIVILAGYLEKIEIMESALNALNRSKRDEDRRGEMEQIIDSCCIKINQYFVSSITGRGLSSEKTLRCPGYAHVIAHDSRMICKNELILKSLEKMSLKWKNPLKAQDIKARLNQFAESCLEKAGTPFFDWMS